MKFLQLYQEKLGNDLKDKALSVYDNMNALSQDQADIIVNYLENGLVLYEFVSPIQDIIDPNDTVPYLVLSDGQYAWDGMLIHWVKKYRVLLPEYFIDHVLNGQKAVTASKEIMMEQFQNAEVAILA